MPVSYPPLTRLTRAQVGELVYTPDKLSVHGSEWTLEEVSRTRILHLPPHTVLQKAEET